MSWLFAASWLSGNRAVRCPYCARDAVVPRRPVPEEVRCRSCGRTFRVTSSGAVPLGPSKAGRPKGR